MRLINLMYPTKFNQQIHQESNHESTTRLLDFIITSSIVLIFFLCPLFFLGLTARGIGFEKIMLFYFLILIASVSWIIKGIVRGKLELKRTPLDLPILLTLIILAISTIFSVNIKNSLIGFYENLPKSFLAGISFIIFYYLLVNNINIKKIKLIFWSLIASSSLIIVYSFLQLFQIFILPFQFTHFANFNPINSLSGLTVYLIIILPLLIVAISQIKKIHPNLNKIEITLIKIILSIIIFGLLAVLIILNTFTPWFAAVIGIAIILIFFLSKIIPVAGNDLIIPLLSFFVIIGFLIFGNLNLINLNLPAEVSLSRGASWDIAKKSLAENPLIGSGPATFDYNFSQFKGSNFNSSPLWNVRFNNARGMFFEYLSTIGILGVLPLMVAVLIVLVLSFLVLIKENINKEAMPILLGLFASYVTVIICATLFSLNNSMLLFTFLISIFTISSAISIYPEKFASIKLSFQASPKYALVLAGLFLGVSSGIAVLFIMGLKIYLADAHFKTALINNDTNKKINIISKAIKLFPYEDVYYLEAANNYMAIANQEAVNAKDSVKIENNLRQAIIYGKKAVEISPNSVRNIESLALIYENASFYTKGALEWSENLYNQLITLDPYNPIPNFRLALINMARANTEEDEIEKQNYIEEAIKKYDEAIVKKSDLAPAHYGKAIAYENLKDNNQAIEQLKKAVISSQNNINYRFELARLYFNRGVTQQPVLTQNIAREIAQAGIEDTNQDNAPIADLSVQQRPPMGSTVSRNDDLKIAEQIFLSVLQEAPNHANALYSLALLYQKLDEKNNAEIAVKRLLEIVEDEKTQEMLKEQFKSITN